MNCPLCKSSDTESFEVREDALYYRYCVGCGSFYLNDTSQQDRTIYERPAEMYFGQEYQERYQELFNYFRKTIEFNIGKEKGSFLEIGFCNPAILTMLAKEGWQTTGIDLTTCEELETILNKANVRFIHDDVLNTNLDEQFDVVWATHVVEHFCLRDLEFLLEQMRNWVSDTGIIIITSPDAGLRFTNHPLLLNFLKPAEHHFVCSESAFLNIARRCGLRRIWSQIAHQDQGFQTKGEWRMAFRKSDVPR